MVIELEEVSEDKQEFDSDRASNEVLWLGEELTSAHREVYGRTFCKVPILFSM